jgi:hypothetical protein
LLRNDDRAGELILMPAFLFFAGNRPASTRPFDISSALGVLNIFSQKSPVEDIGRQVAVVWLPAQQALSNESRIRRRIRFPYSPYSM